MRYSHINHIIASFIFIILPQLSMQSNDTIIPRMLAEEFFKEGPVRKLKLVNMIWENCGSPNDPGRLYSVQVQHTPLGDVNAAVKAGTLVELIPPVKLDLDVRIKTFGTYVKMPCMRKVLGSCKFDDLCKWGERFPACPFKPLRDAHIPCRCPIPKGIYEASGEFPNPTTKYANSLTGDLSITARLTYGGNNHLSCYRFNVTVA